MASRSREHAAVNLTVDLAILTVREDELKVLLVERGHDPFEGMLALPGGFLRPDEDVVAAARRELAEETGLSDPKLPLIQLSVYAEPKRDPRGRVITVPYLAIAPNLPAPKAGSDAAAAHWKPVRSILQEGTPLAFDHRDILEEAVERARHELEYTTIAPAFCADTFTIGDLRAVYEVVWGQQIDPRNFNRKVTKTEDFVRAVGRRRAQEVGRPAMLYQRGDARSLNPPMLRAGIDD